MLARECNGGSAGHKLIKGNPVTAKASGNAVLEFVSEAAALFQDKAKQSQIEALAAAIYTPRTSAL